MKKQMLLLMLMVLTSVITGCDKQSKEKEVDAETLVATANELDRNFIEAYNQKDVEKMMSLYWNSPDLYSYMPGSMMTQGFEETKKSMMEDFKMNPNAKLELHDAKNMVFGDVVVGHGTFTWTMEKDGEEPIVSKGRYTDVKAMKDGKLVYVIDHASEPMMPPPSKDEKAEQPAKK